MLLDPSPLQAIAVVGAGLAAGVVNALAGGGTLISYPALLAVGLPPIPANISSSVGLLPGYASSAAGYSAELRQLGRSVVALAAAALVGGLMGAGLLLTTPATAFEVLVPPLIGLGTVLLALQPRVAAWIGSHRSTSRPRGAGAGLIAAVVVCGMYGAYFGAGLGVLLLAVLGIARQGDLLVDTALRSLLSLIAVTAGVAVYIGAGRVAWDAAALLVAGSVPGGWLGARFGRRLDRSTLRRIVVAVGVVATVVLTVSTYA